VYNVILPPLPTARNVNAADCLVILR